MPRFLVVRVRQKEDTEYDMRYIVDETIDVADTVELTLAEKDQLESDRYSVISTRCLEVVGPTTVRELIQEQVQKARKAAAAAAARAEAQRKATAKRKATLAQRKLEAAKQLLAESGVEVK